MVDFIKENFATIVISALLLAAVISILINLVKKRKSGKSIGCDCECDSCPMQSVPKD